MEVLNQKDQFTQTDMEDTVMKQKATVYDKVENAKRCELIRIVSHTLNSMSAARNTTKFKYCCLTVTILFLMFVAAKRGKDTKRNCRFTWYKLQHRQNDCPDI